MNQLNKDQIYLTTSNSIQENGYSGVACCESVRRKTPMNFIFLGLFTICEGFLLGVAASTYSAEAVLMAAGITTFICLALTVFSFQTKWDITGYGSYLFIGLIVLLLFGILAMIIPGTFGILNIVYACLGALLFSFYLDEILSSDAGVLLVAGATNWDFIARKITKAPPQGVNVQNLYGPHVWSAKTRIRTVASSAASCHSALITEDGKVMTWGRNESGQLGLGDTETRYQPTLVTNLEDENIVQIATGKGHTLFLNDKGVVYGTGDNKMGQLGLGNKGKIELLPLKISYKGKPIVKISCGGEFSMILDLSGILFSFGSPEYGQLGHNSDGQMLEKAGRITYNCEMTPRRITTFIEKARGVSTAVKEVVVGDVKCGNNHTVAIDTKGRLFTWGFAGYGRLGHSETKDEMVPRQIKQLENMRFQGKRIAAGSTFCLASDNNKMLYLWGQNKPAGEATMYPKPVQDLCGWNVRSIACANKSIVIAADESVISWGPAPTYGELAYGENRQKTSTTPQEVKPLEGIHIKEVSCGYAHTLMIGRDETMEERKLLQKLPTWP